jgi:hypothetical protein
MKRLMTSTCLAAAFAVGLAAQSTTAGTSGQDPQGQGRGGPRPVTATGCLRAGDTAGSYMLTDVQMQGGGRRGGDTTGTTAGGGTTGGTTAGTTGGGTTTAGAGQARGNMPTTLMLSPAADVDLKAHVGHKIEVTGTMMGRGGQGAGTTGGTTAGGGGTTTGSTTTGSTTTSGTTGSGTTTAGAGTQGGGRGGRNVTVTSVRMISESCS